MVCVRDFRDLCPRLSPREVSVKVGVMEFGLHFGSAILQPASLSYLSICPILHSCTVNYANTLCNVSKFFFIVSPDHRPADV